MGVAPQQHFDGRLTVGGEQWLAALRTPDNFSEILKANELSTSLDLQIFKAEGISLLVKTAELSSAVTLSHRTRRYVLAQAAHFHGNVFECHTQRLEVTAPNEQGNFLGR